MSLSKSKIVQHFNRAAAHYDRFAKVQHDISADLVSAVDGYANTDKDTIEIADFGCGTGSLIKALSDLGYRNLLGFDIASSMLEEAKRKCPADVSFACSDIESLPVADDSFDVIVSNAAFQWCRSENTFAEISRTLRRGGRAFVSTFGPQTLIQWKEAFSKVGDSRVHSFETKEQLARSINKSGLSLLNLEAPLIDVTFTSVAAMFDSVRRIGASNAQPSSAGKRISKSDYQAVKANFQRTLQAQGKLTLTYEVINIVVSKPK